MYEHMVKICSKCGKPDPDDQYWPDDMSGLLCQECWEDYCNVEYWKMVEQMYKAGLLEEV